VAAASKCEWQAVSHAAALFLGLACTACSAQYESHWDGRRGYDGKGAYGYDLAASEAIARGYRARAAGSYPVPGSPDDPWGLYIHDAASRFGVPERWVREVMRQESGGRLYGNDGALITSSAGAMGLMQVMPQTYESLRNRYGLGEDPYEPRNNILAGAAYIREMYDRYGAPAFLAAYNAGPDCVDAYLADGTPLPDETVGYLASVAPRLGGEVAMTGPLAVFASGAPSNVADSNRAYAGVGLVQPASYVAPASAANDDPSLRAFDGGGLVTPAAPTGVLTGQAPPQVVRSPVVSPLWSAPIVWSGGWGIQVGAFDNPVISRAAIERAQATASDLLASSQPAIIPVQRGAVLYRARLMGLSASAASAACGRLAADGIDCFTVPPGP
jgi:soluble lytic murein transglycosylase-like protein